MWNAMWRRSMGWGSGFESFRFSLQNDPPRFPNLFWKVRENENGSMTETHMKSRLFAYRFDEKIILGMETQGLHPRQFAIITSVVVATFFARVFTCGRIAVLLRKTALLAAPPHPSLKIPERPLRRDFPVPSGHRLKSRRAKPRGIFLSCLVTD